MTDRIPASSTTVTMKIAHEIIEFLYWIDSAEFYIEKNGHKNCDFK